MTRRAAVQNSENLQTHATDLPAPPPGTTVGGMGRKEDALDYHSRGRKGKLEVVPTKPLVSQLDLSLAYSPGVAEPCLEIARDEDR